MNKYILIISAMLICSACVDDFTDANPPRQLDAPGVSVSAAPSPNLLVQAVPVNPFQSNYEAFIVYGTTGQIKVNVLRAPGKVAQVSVVPSIPEFGTVSIDEASVTALKGAETGTFTFNFTPSTTLPNLSQRRFDLVVTVTDSQLDTKSGESSPQSTTLTVTTTLLKGCLAQGIAAKSYKVISASGNLDGGAAITLEDIEAEIGSPVIVTVTKPRPGLFIFNEITGGVWPAFYSGRANPALQVDLCGTIISGREGAVTAGAGSATARIFTIAGTQNGDGTITITWSYARVTGATPANPAKGTYTLGTL